MISGYSFRHDGKLHDYAIYKNNPDGSVTWGFEWSLAALDVGEAAQTDDGTIVTVSADNGSCDMV